MYPTWRSLIKQSKPHTLTTKRSNGHKYGIHGHLIDVMHEMHEKRTPTGVAQTTILDSKADMTVTGKFIQHTSRPSQKVIFWIYGGAYLAGDSDGNLGIAEKMGMMCGDANSKDNREMRDIFIPDYRLVPENNLDDAIHDITLAYEWLIYERGIQPENIALLGISSGGGLAVLLMQSIAAYKRKVKETENLMPAGAVLMGPFVDYTKPKGSFSEYTKHDLIVNQVSYMLQPVLNNNWHHLSTNCILQIIISLSSRRVSHILKSFSDLTKIGSKHHQSMAI
jgi:acetyl esterase/lipase